jgi:sialate O-acetylesterase
MFKIASLFIVSTIFFAVYGVNLANGEFENEERIVDLEGKWKFSIGDDSLWASPKYYDEDWEVLYAPSSWEDEGYHGYNGYAWYRKHFKISGRYKNQTINLHLGRVDDVDEVYINGNLVGFSGSFPPEYETAYNVWRSYPVSPSFLNFEGDNVIAVRVYDSEQAGGIVQGELGLYIYPFSVQKEIDLEGEWKFTTGDNLNWSKVDFNDNDWKNMIVPGNWNSKNLRNYDGYAWYRKKVFIPSSLQNKKLILLLGKIDDVDQTFLNGKMIGYTGNFDLLPGDYYQNGKYREVRGYYIPQNLVQYDAENVIAVRVYDGYNIGGIYEGPVGIILQEKYTRYWKQIKKGKNIFEILFGD